MKISFSLLLILLPASRMLHAQGGPLAPPGPPGPTMTTLSAISAQIAATDLKVASLQLAVGNLRSDPRTVITAAPFTVSTPGSYVLHSDLAVTSGTAITIMADDVTLDLNGFAIRSTASPASGSGILISGGRRNIRIGNGTITGTTTRSGSTFTPGGFNSGISIFLTNNRNFIISDLRVSGMAQDGIGLGLTGVNTFITERCTVTTCGGGGIVGDIVRACTATECGGTAITADVVGDSAGESVSLAAGMHGISATSASNCRGQAVAGIGVSATVVINCSGVSASSGGVAGEQLANCNGTSQSSHGVSGRQISNCTGSSTSGTGIWSSGNVTNSTGTSTSGPFGIFADGTASYCIGQRNSGVAISSEAAIGCSVTGTGTITSAKKFLGTP